jgi:hypothetical protein
MLAAHFENGALGNSILATDPGSPDKLDATVVNGTDATNIYDNAHARGVLSARFRTLATGDTTALCRWSATSYVTSTDSYHRLYLYLSANPVNASAICAVDVAGAIGPRIRINADRLLRVTDAAGTVRATSAVALPTGQMVRLDWHVVHDLAAGSSTLRVFTTDPEARPRHPIRRLDRTRSRQRDDHDARRLHQQAHPGQRPPPVRRRPALRRKPLAALRDPPERLQQQRRQRPHRVHRARDHVRPRPGLLDRLGAAP